LTSSVAEPGHAPSGFRLKTCCGFSASGSIRTFGRPGVAPRAASSSFFQAAAYSGCSRSQRSASAADTSAEASGSGRGSTRTSRTLASEPGSTFWLQCSLTANPSASPGPASSSSAREMPHLGSGVVKLHAYGAASASPPTPRSSREIESLKVVAIGNGANGSPTSSAVPAHRQRASIGGSTESQAGGADSGCTSPSGTTGAEKTICTRCCSSPSSRPLGAADVTTSGLAAAPEASVSRPIANPSCARVIATP